MNEIVKAPARRKWTLAELDRLSALGFFGEHEHVELIRGELLTMPAKGIRHENVRGEVADALISRLPPNLRLRVELGWRPRPDIYLEPDILIAHSQQAMPLVPPERVVLLIEIAKSSLAYDHGYKAALYAELGVAEYWVVDAEALVTRTHRQPGPDGYRDVQEAAPHEAVTSLSEPTLSFRLSEFDFGTEGLGEDDP